MRKNDTAVPNNGQPQKLKTPWETRKARIGAEAVERYKVQPPRPTILEKYADFARRQRDPRRELAAAINRAVDLVERIIGGVRA